MKNNPHDNTTEEQDKTNPDDTLPVINIDDDPDNANWLRILAKRREEEAAKQQPQQQQQQPPQK